MGAAYNLPDSLAETYIAEPEHGCVARLEYHISGWAAFWIQLNGLDASAYNTLTFYAKGDPALGIPATFKVEVKRNNNGEVSIVRVPGLTDSWQPFTIPLTDFQPFPGMTPLSGWDNLSELVFTFEINNSGSQGVMYLDNIAFEKR